MSSRQLVNNMIIALNDTSAWEVKFNQKLCTFQLQKIEDILAKPAMNHTVLKNDTVKNSWSYF